MKMNCVFMLLLVVFCFSVGGCTTTTSDSGIVLKSVGNKADSNIYVLDVTMLGDTVSNKNFSGEGTSKQYSDIYGFGNSRIWQEGKGMVSVHVNSISPALSYVQPGMDIVLKTSDLKIMAISEGYRFQVKCRSDYEPVAALQENEIANERYDTYELDYCRMGTPEIQFDMGG